PRGKARVPRSAPRRPPARSRGGPARRSRRPGNRRPAGAARCDSCGVVAKASQAARSLGVMHVSSYVDIEPFVTLDGSEIREWAGRVSAPAEKQSLAEATVPV